MKYLGLALLVVSFGCNNNDDKAASVPGDNTATAEQNMIQDLRKYPDSTLLAENLVQYYRDAGRYEQAIAIVNQQLAKDSLSSRLWDIKATLSFENADTVAAIQSFEKAVEIAADPQYLIALGTLYAETKNPDALVVSDALLRSNAKAEKEAWFIKGLYYSYNNEKIKAIPFFDKSLSISYTYMVAYTEKSLALYDLGKYNEALAVLDKALTLQNNYDEGYYYRGLVLEKLKRNAEAIDAYQMALRFDPDYIEAKNALAKLGVK